MARAGVQRGRLPGEPRGRPACHTPPERRGTIGPSRTLVNVERSPRVTAAVSARTGARMRIGATNGYAGLQYRASVVSPTAATDLTVTGTIEPVG